MTARFRSAWGRRAVSLSAPAASLAILLSSLYFAPIGCASSATTKPQTLCTPQQEVYCRCQNFDEGTKICADDGNSFGACEPCPGDTFPDDGGDIGSDDGAAGDASMQSSDAEDGGGSTCGNGIVDPGEACDDGNKVEDDGCNSSCQPEGGYPAKAGICPGMAIHVWSAPVTFAGTTNLFPITYRAKAACGGSTGSTGSDRVYAITVHSAGTLTAKTTNATFDDMLYARSDCATEASELGCANASAGTGDESLAVPVVSGATVFLIVDGTSNATGTFTLSLSAK